MNLPPSGNALKSYLSVSLMIFWLIFGGSTLLYAHSGSPLSAPTGVAASININGTIDNAGTETVWGAGVEASTLPNTCAEFSGMTGAPVTFYALNDGVNLYLAFDIPDASANANDLLFLAFDPNHGAGSNPAADDRALKLTFNNTAASNLVPQSEFYSGTGAAWSGATAGLPPGVEAKYSRIATGSGKWQLEMKLPFTGPTIGFAFEYFNETGDAAEDCNGDGDADDFYAPFPSTLTIVSPISLPAGIANPSLWGNLDFGPQPPTVRFQSPLCCHSADITFNPSALPFTAGVPVNIFAQVHNLHATSVANNVNVEVRVHKFGTGGGIIFTGSTVIASIAASGQTFSNPVQWPSPPAGIHGCIQAEIKPPTVSQYFIAGGASIAQYNIDVACVPQGESKTLLFTTFNPTLNQEARFTLMKQTLLPRGFEKMTFDLEQPVGLPPRGEREVRLTVRVPADTPTTEVEKQTLNLPPTAGGATVPPLGSRSGTDAVSIPVRPGQRLHLSATGQVDLDGGGPWPAAGPDGQNLEKEVAGKPLLGGQPSAQFAGALIGSFTGFVAPAIDVKVVNLPPQPSGFLIGSESTVVVPQGAERLWLAVNDIDGAYADNSGAGFAVEASTLPPLDAADAARRAAGATAVTLPQVNVTAVTTARVTAGEHTYNLLTNHGGLVYQLLVVGDGGRHIADGEPATAWPWFYWLLLALLGLFVLIIIWRIISKKPAS